jgi:hypothetical protein
MGLFYTTFTIYGAEQSKIMAVVKKLRRTAYVSPTLKRHTVVYDRKAEDQDFKEIEKLGRKLSQGVAAPVLAAALHDDDVLYLWLFRAGKTRDFYNSLPQYFDADAEPGPPEGGNSELLCNAFDRPRKKKRVEKLLRANLLDGELPEIAGELARHQALVKELGMPAYAAAVTFSSVAGRYMPEEFRKIRFVRVGGRNHS